MNAWVEGAKLRAAFLASGENWKHVEMNVKKWNEDKKTRESTECDVTKAMLKEIYHWDQLGSQNKCHACMYYKM